MFKVDTTRPFLVYLGSGEDRESSVKQCMGEDDVQTPARWKGTNVLGWALMRVRAALRAVGSDADSTMLQDSR